MAATRAEWWSRYIVAPIVTGILAGVVAGVLLLLASPMVAKAILQPSCANPRGLVLEKPRIDGTPAARGRNAADNLLDGSTSSVWVPPAEATTTTPVRFSFDHEVDLQLICVVNGQPESQVAYDRAGKVRAFTVGTDATAGRQEPVSPLIVQPAGQIQNSQNLEFDRGGTRSVTLSVASTYTGLREDDPTTTEFDEASAFIAVAEVEFYVAEDRS